MPKLLSIMGGSERVAQKIRIIIFGRPFTFTLYNHDYSLSCHNGS